ncbi:MAG: anti-sigma factor [Pontixanthobacter sp.]
MTDTTAPLPPEADLRAAELALGLLDGEDRRDAQAERRSDPVFDRAVGEWERFADGFIGDGEERQDSVDVPASLWDRIAASIGMPVAANDDAGAAMVVRTLDGGRPSRSIAWPLAAMAASVVALVFAGLWVARDSDLADKDARIAALSDEVADADGDYRVAQVNAADTPALLTALYDGASGEMTVRVQTDNNEGLVPELWVIGPDGAPRSLGQSADKATIVIPLTEAMQADIAAGSAIAISLEPKADRPSDAPTAENILGAAQLVPLT